MNQPFANENQSKIYWGLSINGVNSNNIPTRNNPTEKLIVTSPTENKKYLNALKSLGYEIVFSSGAGHKILKVVVGDVACYFLSKGSTYKWDSCAGQAILNSMEDAGIVDYKASLAGGCSVLLDYDDGGETCNTGGLIAYRNLKDAEEILEKLRSLQ